MKINNVRIIASNAPVYDIEINSEDHLYAMANVVTHNCCRLINDNDLFTLGGQVNSFGGSALSLGSHRVCTVNMRRIAVNCNSIDEYKKRLAQKMAEATEILHAHKELIRDLIKKGTQPFMENGWLDIDRMFSTIGILGYYEGIQDLINQCGGNYEDILRDILLFINKQAEDLTRTTADVILNIEGIPGETMAIKFADTDRWIYGEERIPEKIYANQLLPLWVDSTIEEKCEVEGIGSVMTGGSIAHLSCGEKITSKQARHLIDLMMSSGLEHCAINPVYTSCPVCQHFTLGKFNVCPRCGNSDGLRYLTRTVGFFIFVDNMTTVKREEDFEKRHYKEHMGL